jgi:hypothetical protein
MSCFSPTCKYYIFYIPSRKIQEAKAMNLIFFLRLVNEVEVILVSLRKWLPELLIDKTKSNKLTQVQRSGSDRRVCKPVQRLRTGLWFAYDRVAGEGRFSEVHLSQSTKDKLDHSLPTEISKYSFSRKDSGTTVPPTEVLEEALIRAWQILKSKSDFAKAVYITDAVVSQIEERYDIKTIDRRSQPTVIQFPTHTIPLAS